MNNLEKWLFAFKRQFPQFNNANISMNLYGDVMDLNTKVRKVIHGCVIDGHEIIATSNITHDLEKVGFLVPTKWTLTDYGKTL